MSLLVKICGLRDEHHVSVAISAGADALGFVFADSARRISPRAAAAICQAVPQHIRRVAVMLHPCDDEWQHVLQQFEPDVLQTDMSDFESLQVPASVECWPVYREGDDSPGDAKLYVYEGAASGRGATVDWSQARTLAAGGHMILAGGLNADNVAKAIRQVRPMGVDVSSGVESVRGQKNAARISEFIRAARAAEKEL